MVKGIHYCDGPETPAKLALAAAEKLGVATYFLCKAKLEVQGSSEPEQKKGASEISGEIELRGRAIEKFADALPTRKCEEFRECLSYLSVHYKEFFTIWDL